jgi:hypothetical protein
MLIFSVIEKRKKCPILDEFKEGNVFYPTISKSLKQGLKTRFCAF